MDSPREAWVGWHPLRKTSNGSIMGFFSKITSGLNQAIGGVDQELLNSGVLARAQVISAVPSGSTLQVGGGLVERTCTFQLQVLADGQAPYVAEAKQRVPEVYLTQFQPGTAVAVRVDPADPNRLALDFTAQPPSVRLAKSEGPGTGPYVLRNGADAEVVVVQSGAAGFQNYQGYEMYNFALTVIRPGIDPYQVQVANAVPPESLPLLYPGARLHAKVGTEPHQVVTDFERGAVA